MNADDMHAFDVLGSDLGVRGVVVSVRRYRELVASQVDDEAGALGTLAELEALRRELAERDDREREAEAKLAEAVRKIRDGSRVAGGWDPELVDEDVLDSADRIVRLIATAPATAIAAVLPATSEDAAVLREWQADETRYAVPPAIGAALAAAKRAAIIEPVDDDLEGRVTDAIWIHWRREADSRDACRAAARAALGIVYAERAAPWDHPYYTRDTVDPREVSPSELEELRARIARHRESVPRKLYAGQVTAAWSAWNAAGEIIERLAALLGHIDFMGDQVADLFDRLAECEAERRAIVAVLDQFDGEPDAEGRALPQRIEEMLLGRAVEIGQLMGEAAHPEPAEAGPLVEWIARRIGRHDWDDRESAATVAREITAHVERSLPTVLDLAHVIADSDGDPSVSDESSAWREIYLNNAREVSGTIRARLGLDAAAPEREEPSEPKQGTYVVASRDIRYFGNEPAEASEPEPPGTWAKVRAAVAEFASTPRAGRIGDQGKVAAALHRWKAERPEPDAVSVEAVRAEIEKRCKGSDWRMSSTAVFEAAHAIVARFGSPPTVPVLALPSVEEVAHTIHIIIAHRNQTSDEAAPVVLDLVRNAQPAAAREWAALSEANRAMLTAEIRSWGGHYRVAADLLAACAPEPR